MKHLLRLRHERIKCLLAASDLPQNEASGLHLIPNFDEGIESVLEQLEDVSVRSRILLVRNRGGGRQLDQDREEAAAEVLALCGEGLRRCLLLAQHRT